MFLKIKWPQASIVFTIVMGSSTVSAAKNKRDELKQDKSSKDKRDKTRQEKSSKDKRDKPKQNNKSSKDKIRDKSRQNKPPKDKIRQVKRQENTISQKTGHNPLVIGGSIAAAAFTGIYLFSAWKAFKTRSSLPRFYPGGFEPVMSRIEAAKILGVRQDATLEKIKEAHRRVMIANHPDCGGSNYLAMKINEAIGVLKRRPKNS